MDIYLIEDDTIYSEFIRRTLGVNTSYSITVFNSVEAAIPSIDKKLPDVLILDYKLPGMSGIELYERIKSRITEDKKVIVMSAIDDGNMVLSFIQKGVRDYVIKDENVIESLTAVLEGKDEDYYLFN